MRTPVILVAGQTDTDPVIGALLRTPGTLVVMHRFDGLIVALLAIGLAWYVWRHWQHRLSKE